MLSDKKTILLVSDVKGWAFDHIAEYLKSLLEEDYNVQIIYSGDYGSPYALLETLTKCDTVSFIHFFWRGTLDILLQYIASNRVEAAILEKFLQIAVITSIPDHLSSNSTKELESYKNTLTFADNYYTTSEILRDIYSNIANYPKPYDVIYDNVLMNRKPNFAMKDRLEVTWIGNSKAGSFHFGKEFDLKGLESVIKPVSERIKKEYNIIVNIIDGATKKLSKDEVYDILHRTDILLSSSKCEGTPLPLIEAMASGCAIITTNVGIAPEILPEIQKKFILERNIEDFVAAIESLNSDRNLLQELKHQNYEAYKNIFMNKEFFKTKWMNLIENSIKKAQTHITVKMDILKVMKDDYNNISIIEKIKKRIRRIIHSLRFRLFGS